MRRTTAFAHILLAALLFAPSPALAQKAPQLGALSQYDPAAAIAMLDAFNERDWSVGEAQDLALRVLEQAPLASLQAAAARDPRAQLVLGWAHDFGIGVAENDVEAVRLYRLAVDAGFARAQATLSFMLINGYGVAMDANEAARLARLSADQNNAVGIANLATYYEEGVGGVPRDLGEAMRLYRRAADMGDSYAAERLIMLGEQTL